MRWAGPGLAWLERAGGVEVAGGGWVGVGVCLVLVGVVRLWAVELGEEEEWGERGEGGGNFRVLSVSH